MRSLTGRFAGLLLPILLVSTLPASADESAPEHSQRLFEMLKRMSEADSSTNYRGTFVMIKPGELSTMRVTHGRDENGIWESLESLNGEARKVIRHDDRVITVYPDRDLVTIRGADDDAPLHFSLPDNVDQLSRHYSMQQRRDDRIADRHTIVVDLMPNDDYRYGYRYWIDNETGMLLRCDLIDENDIVVEQMMFTSLDYLPGPPRRDFSLKEFKRYRQHLIDSRRQGVSRDTQSQSAQAWAIEQLPAGFRLTETMRHSSRFEHTPGDGETADADAKKIQAAAPDDGSGILHIVYSDGLASVSVFIELDSGESQHLAGPASMGAVNAFGNPVGDHYVTVVGEVPPKTVKLLAESIRQQAD